MYRAIDNCMNTQNNVVASGCYSYANAPQTAEYSWWKTTLSVPVGKLVTKLVLYNRQGLEQRLAGAEIFVDGRSVAKVPSSHQIIYELSLAHPLWRKSSTPIHTYLFVNLKLIVTSDS